MPPEVRPYDCGYFQVELIFNHILRICVCLTRHLTHRIIANPISVRPSDYESGAAAENEVLWALNNAVDLIFA